MSQHVPTAATTVILVFILETCTYIMKQFDSVLPMKHYYVMVEDLMP